MAIERGEIYFVIALVCRCVWFSLNIENLSGLNKHKIFIIARWLKAIDEFCKCPVVDPK